MKLKVLHEGPVTTLYKGMNEKDFHKFKNHNIPGFMADKYLAMIYAQPSLANTPDETMYFISAPIDMEAVIDKSGVVSDMCSDWVKEHPELRDQIWTAPGSGFGGQSAIYCGQPVSWTLEAVFRGEDEWKKAWESIKN